MRLDGDASKSAWQLTRQTLSLGLRHPLVALLPGGRPVQRSIRPRSTSWPSCHMRKGTLLAEHALGSKACEVLA
jgi:hypothetical protein